MEGRIDPVCRSVCVEDAIDIVTETLEKVKKEDDDPSEAAWVVSMAMNTLFMKRGYVFVVRCVPAFGYEQL